VERPLFLRPRVGTSCTDRGSTARPAGGSLWWVYRATTPPASTPTLAHPPGPGKNAAPAKTVAPGKKAAPSKRTGPVAKDTARSGRPGTETNKDRTIHFDVGPVEIDIPRTLGYYGGISAAVAFGVLEPPVAVFIAALPVIKMLVPGSRRHRCDFSPKYCKAPGNRSAATVRAPSG